MTPPLDEPTRDDANGDGSTAAPGGSESPAVPPAPVPADLAESFRMNTRILQYIHDSHARLVSVLERGDRSEMVIQSTEALNRTFRRLQESQEQLAEKLVAHERRRPLAMGLTALAGALAVLVCAWILTRFGGREADPVAAAAQAGDLERIVENTGQLLETIDRTIDRGLSANRVLLNENQAQHQELAALKAHVDEIGRSQGLLADQAAAATAENARLARELETAKEQLVAKDMATAELNRLIDARLAAAGAAPNAAPEAPAPAAPASAAPDPAASAPTEPPAAPRASAADLALETGVIGAMNRLLRDSGVIDLRLLSCGGLEGDALRAVTFEVRTAEGFPIGFHQAATCRLALDAAGGGGALVLEHGESVLRSVRTPFPNDRLEIRIAALPALAPPEPEIAALFAPLAPTAPVANASPPAAIEALPLTADPAPAVAEPAVPNPAARAVTFSDPRAALRLVNAQLRSDGYGAYEFFQVAGRDGDALSNVQVHHYRADGTTQKTVVAKRCEIAVDAARGSVKLVFRDGRHNTKGKDVPFFQAAGDLVGSWTLELDRADTRRWRELVDRLRELE